MPKGQVRVPEPQKQTCLLILGTNTHLSLWSTLDFPRFYTGTWLGDTFGIRLGLFFCSSENFQVVLLRDRVLGVLTCLEGQGQKPSTAPHHS